MTNACDAFILVVRHQAVALIATTQFKRPDDQTLNQVMFTLMKEKFGIIEHVKTGNPKSPANHLQVVLDGFQVLNWPIFNGEPILKDMTKEAYSNVSFFGNKVRKLKQEKDNEWFDSFDALCCTIKDFLLKNAETLPDWSPLGKREGFEDWFDAASSPDALNDFSFMEGLADGGGAEAPTKAPSAKKPAAVGGLAADFEAACADKIKAWQEAAAALAIPQVTKATEQYISCIGFQAALLRTMAKFKKPQDLSFIQVPYVPLAQDL